MMVWDNNGWSGWEVAVMWVGMIAFWALVIWAVYTVVAHTNRRHVVERHQDTATKTGPSRHGST